MRAKLTEPGRMAEFMKTFKPAPADLGEQLANVQYPALIIMAPLTPTSPTPTPRAKRLTLGRNSKRLQGSITLSNSKGRR